MCTSELVLYWSCRCRYLGCKSINDIIFPVCLANSDGGSEHALGLSLPQLLRNSLLCRASINFSIDVCARKIFLVVPFKGKAKASGSCPVRSTTDSSRGRNNQLRHIYIYKDKATFLRYWVWPKESTYLIVVTNELTPLCKWIEKRLIDSIVQVSWLPSGLGWTDQSSYGHYGYQNPQRKWKRNK